MSRFIVACFAREEDVLAATQSAKEKGMHIVDVYTPYAVHGLDHAMGLGPSRLGWLCCAFGFLGVVFAFAFQFWTMSVNWPVNVGGKPWNSLPAFVPVAFEVMVLLGGLGVVLAFLIICRLYPGKQPHARIPDATNDSFVLVVEGSDYHAEAGAARSLFQRFNAVYVEEEER
jgi:hypothetical protein